MAQETKEGRSAPLGATLSREGANFSVYSKHATGIELLLFDGVNEARPTRVIRLDPATNRTYHYWHVFVPGVQAGQIYGYRVGGAFDPPSGMRFDPAKVLVDPYGRGAVVPKNCCSSRLLKKSDSCFDRLSTNGKSPTIASLPPFALSLSKGERRVFQQPAKGETNG